MLGTTRKGDIVSGSEWFFIHPVSLSQSIPTQRLDQIYNDNYNHQPDGWL
ncbi:hypothetical protein [Vibrio hepatarius]|nr:hypothetical protein [Vibrio hepatarius]NIY83676.1 hypothetical protein [Vibrio hepatarius]